MSSAFAMSSFTSGKTRVGPLSTVFAVEEHWQKFQTEEHSNIYNWFWSGVTATSGLEEDCILVETGRGSTVPVTLEVSAVQCSALRSKWCRNWLWFKATQMLCFYFVRHCFVLLPVELLAHTLSAFHAIFVLFSFHFFRRWKRLAWIFTRNSGHRLRTIFNWVW